MDGCNREAERMGREGSRSTYMDSSSLLAHRLTDEPSLSWTTMRFSLGLFSGGDKSAAHKQVQGVFCQYKPHRQPSLCTVHYVSVLLARNKAFSIKYLELYSQPALHC